MAARNFTGSAGIRSSKANTRTQNLAAKLAEIETRVATTREEVLSAIHSLREDRGVESEIASKLEQHALTALTEASELLGKLAPQSA